MVFGNLLRFRPKDFSNFLPQYFVLAVLVADFVFQQIRDLEWVDTWFVFGAFDTCGIFGSFLWSRACENVERFSKCADRLDRKR
jgi:hypothetical protein